MKPLEKPEERMAKEDYIVDEENDTEVLKQLDRFEEEKVGNNDSDSDWGFRMIIDESIILLIWQIVYQILLKQLFLKVFNLLFELHYSIVSVNIAGKSLWYLISNEDVIWFCLYKVIKLFIHHLRV